MQEGTTICGVLQLTSRTVYGFTKKKIPKKKFIPLDSKLPHFIVGTKKQYQSSDVYAIVKFTEMDKGGVYACGVLDRIIGDVGDYEVEKDFLKDRHNTRWKKIVFDPDQYSLDLTPKRVSFVDKFVVTIDPLGCLDVDDAIHYCELPTHIELGVHIADVSSYIPENSNLDLAIRQRGESIYMLHEQIDMLPVTLASDICSLIEGVERRTYSVIFKLNKSDLTVQNVEFTKGVIINKKKCSYEYAQKLIDDKDNKSELGDNLKKLYSVGNVLYSKKFPNSNSYDVHKMIEIFMLMTNIKVAEYLSKNVSDKVVLRSQKGFKLPKHDIVKSVPYNVISRANNYRLESAKYLVGVGVGDGSSAHMLLDEECYTHFTSPIRRYIDIIVHRMLWSVNNNRPDKDINNYSAVCNDININHVNIKMLERESKVLDIIYNKIKSDNLTLDTYGFIIKITDNYLLIHIPDLDTDVECKLFSEKVKHLISYESYEEYIKLNDLVLELFEKVKIKVIVSHKATKIRKKLLVQIVEPFLTEMFR